MLIGGMDLRLRDFPSAAATPTVWDDATSLWLLDEKSGARADSIGSNNLTDNATVLYQNMGPSGVVADFDSANSERLTIGSQVLQANSDFTVVSWVRPDGNNMRFWQIADSDADQPALFLEVVNGSNHRVYNRNGYGTAIEIGEHVGRWIMVVYEYVHATTTSRVKVRGALVNDDTWSAGSVAAQAFGSAFIVGGRTGGFYDGQAGPLGVYSRVLTDDEVTSFYNSGKGKAYADLSAGEKTGLVSWWDLDEASGNRADSHGSNTLTDNNTVTSVTNSYPANLPGTVASFTLANSEYLSVANPGWDESAGFTISLWGYAIAQWPSVNRDDTATERSWALPNGTLYGFSDDSTFQSVILSTDATANQWDLWIIWYDPADKKMHGQINDATPRESTALAGAGLQTQTAPFEFGRHSSTYMTGLYSTVAFWPRVLTSDERAELYNSGDGAPLP